MSVEHAKPDVAVVGGGPIGLASAWRAAQRGLSVCVLGALSLRLTDEQRAEVKRVISETPGNEDVKVLAILILDGLGCV